MFHRKNFPKVKNLYLYHRSETEIKSDIFEIEMKEFDQKNTIRKMDFDSYKELINSFEKERIIMSHYF